MRKHKFLYLFLGFILGLGLTYGIIAHGAATDAWNIGDGWLWFATASDDSVKANVAAPVDDENVANKSYVDAGSGGGAGAHYTAWGTTSCASGYTAQYTGLATFPVSIDPGNNYGAMGMIMCVEGDEVEDVHPEVSKSVGDEHGGWVHAYDGEYEDNWIGEKGEIVCAVCIPD